MTFGDRRGGIDVAVAGNGDGFERRRWVRAGVGEELGGDVGGEAVCVAQRGEVVA